jgi:hypothetical protein
LYSLELVRLLNHMALTRRRAKLAIGVVDRPVAFNHLNLAAEDPRTLTAASGACRDPWRATCRHRVRLPASPPRRRCASEEVISPARSLATGRADPAA